VAEGEVGMVFAYSKEAVGRLERDLCAAQARIRELEAALADKDAALAAANCELQGIGLLARDSKISAETRGRELEDRAFLIEEVLAEVRTALTEVEK